MAELQERNLTPLVPAPTGKDSDDIAWALNNVKARQSHYGRFCKYYDGEHDLSFATEKFRNTFASLFRAFADNLCPAIVDALTDRLLITGWDGDLAEDAQDLAKELHFPLVANAVHHEAAKTGDGYVIVWTNKENEVVMWPQSAWNCCVEYDDEYLGRISKAAKVWVVENGEYAGRWRITLYYPDRIERYISTKRFTASAPSTSKSFEPFNGVGGPSITNPYGICPMFHFPNNSSAGYYGRSELQDVIPIQNALNKAVCDMLVAMEFVAMPQRYATGLQVEVDPATGKPRNPPFVPGVDRIWTAGENVKFGEFAQAQLESFIKVQDSLRTEAARVSGTPLHYLMLGTQFPSGESMRTAEARLIKKAEDRQISWSPVWTDSMSLGLLMKNAGGTDVKEQAKQFSPVWNNATPHNPLFDAETQLVKKQVGVSQRQSLRELGYTDTQIDAMEKENEEAAQQAMERQMEQTEQMAKLGAVPGAPRFGSEGKPTAFNRKAPPGQASQPAPRQQQTRRPIQG